MKKWFIIAMTLIGFACSLPSMALAQDEATEASASSELKDNPYFSVLPNYYQTDNNDREFDAYNFYLSYDKFEKVEGKLYKADYQLKTDEKVCSKLQIHRNFENAAKKAGGVKLYEGPAEERATEVLTMKVVQNGKELWLEVMAYNDGWNYLVVVVEREAMKQTITSNIMLDKLNAEGHIALYINFDINKATIKSESKPIIDEIVQLLKDSPTLKLSVEGHTDNTGTAANNKTLSNDRAKSVTDAIIAAGIDGKRLSSVGWGQDKPIEDNKTEAGRAKNRRVELVKK